MRSARSARAISLLVVSVVLLSSNGIEALAFPISLASRTRIGSLTKAAAPIPSLSVNDVSVTEGSSGTIRATFTVTLSAAAAKNASVRYETENGSAQAPGDFQAQSGTKKFSSGHTSRTIRILVNGDTVVEPDETFTIRLTAPKHATIARRRGTATIANDDIPPPSISVGDVSVTEGNAGTVDAVFAVTLSAPVTYPVSVDYATLDASATAPSDYTQKMDTLTFAPGVTSTTVTVGVNGDTAVEPDEPFYVHLSNAVAATITDAFGQGTILNDDVAVPPLPSFSINSPTVTEGNSGTVNAVFTVTLSAASASTVTVDYTTVDGSATAPSDYTSQSGTLTFSPGQSSQQVAVLVKGDTAVETSEAFTVNLSNAVNASVAGSGIGTGTITNDDTLPTATIAAPGATNEGNSGTTNFVFTVTLSAASASTVTVDYTTVDGSATAPSDYTAQSGTLTFLAGQTSQSITVLVKGDTTVETNETFTVNLSNPTNATIAGTGIGTGTINNDDTLPTLTIAAPGRDERRQLRGPPTSCSP